MNSMTKKTTTTKKKKKTMTKTILSPATRKQRDSGSAPSANYPRSLARRPLCWC